MLRYLFPRLTARTPRGQRLFDSAVHEARQRHWYIEGGVADTLDGRFAMLATVCALLIVRIEDPAEPRGDISAALVERFVEAMDAEHRQLGINDPALGRKVRAMVAALARRVGEWRSALAAEADWDEVVRSSVYASAPATAEQLAHCSRRLRELWQRLEARADADIAMGKIDE